LTRFELPEFRNLPLLSCFRRNEVPILKSEWGLVLIKGFTRHLC